MKLYYSPGACSLAPHIVLEELEIPYETIAVDLKTHKLKESGEDYFLKNKKGAVPLLELDDGALLSENAVIQQYLADLVPEKKLFPVPASLVRYRCQEWLNYVATELHKGFENLVHMSNLVAKGECSDQLKASTEKTLNKKFSFIAFCLEENNYLMGADYSIADAYLFTITRWVPLMTSMKIQNWAPLAEHHERVMSRPAVQRALRAEKLL